jgi:transposase-like protein
MSPIDDAIAEIESLEPGESFSYRALAKKYGVVRSTLTRRHQALTTTRAASALNRRKLHPDQERALVRYIEKLTERRIPPTRAMIQNFASEIAKEPVSESWVTRFINQYSDQLISRWVTGMDRDRHNADSASKYKLYFELLQAKITEYNILLSNTYNMDEKGFLIGITGRSKRVFSRRMYEKKEVVESLQDSSREWITTVASICADGSALPPSLIFESANSTIQSTWVEAINAANHSVLVSSSPTGWSNNNIGLAWLEQVFDRYTKAKAKRDYRLLILDGHGSHLTMDFIDYCDRHRILLAILPPHSTHTL